MEKITKEELMAKLASKDFLENDLEKIAGGLSVPSLITRRMCIKAGSGHGQLRASCNLPCIS